MPIYYKQNSVALRSRIWIVVLRLLLKPLMRRWARARPERIARLQLMLAGRVCHNTAGLEQDYRIIGDVPGPVVGPVEDPSHPFILWLHGGAFLLPAVPEVHLRLLALLCRDLGAAGFLPDYRLAPFNPFPCALDDAERAYRGVLELGFDARRIVVAGESAGGHLTLGLLQRIRRHGLPAPACAIAVSPVTELGRAHAPPSRARNRKRDAMIPPAALSRIDEVFTAGQDTADPEVSPLYADYRGFPPLMFVASDSEVLLDDSVLAARRAAAAGVDARADVWPRLPHAFVLFERLFPESQAARVDMVGFMREHIAER